MGKMQQKFCNILITDQSKKFSLTLLMRKVLTSLEPSTTLFAKRLQKSPNSLGRGKVYEGCLCLSEQYIFSWLLR
ncbi:hypothetical protein PsorP6_006762 [Peronosclerospora sorghi]|uniref:Uncharacterized protein n=1 Tax=Peronosclerospora sorghi TaxID=230839 RepID=A0ACC0W2F0_9STRA|nr:hypothetical protein PsorP6_006762 [Peronosclerospora sorghi]